MKKSKKVKLPSPRLKQPDMKFERYCKKGKGVFDLVDIALSSVRGWRTTQEDAHCHQFPSRMDKNLGFLGIFDGHSGSNASAFVGKSLWKYIENSKPFKAEVIKHQNYDPEVLKEATREGFFNCDKALRESPKFKNNPKERSGCTGVMCCLTEKNIIIANTGDSRAVLVRQATDVFSTLDQTPDQDRETTRITNAGCYVKYGRVNGDLATARSFGDFRFKKISLPPSKQAITVEPDITILYRNPREDQLLILACDGVWDVLSNLECANFALAALWLGCSEQETADLIIKECVRKGSGDNISIMVVAMEQAPRYSEPPLRKPTLDEVRRQTYRFVL